MLQALDSFRPGYCATRNPYHHDNQDGYYRNRDKDLDKGIRRSGIPVSQERPGRIRLEKNYRLDMEFRTPENVKSRVVEIRGSCVSVVTTT